MSIQSFALKTITLIALISVSLPAATQQLSTDQTTKNEVKTVATSQTTAVATSVVLTISTASTISYGEDVGGYALVSSSDGTPLSGTVTFYDGATNICTIPVTQTTSCPAGAGTGFVARTHMLTAAYSGDSNHLRSTSNGVPVVVLPDVTTLSLTSSMNPASYGNNVALTATARGNHAVPSGQIEFLDGTNLIATATLNPSGTVSITQSALALGTHPITARYTATQNFGAAASTILNQVIQPSTGMATATTLASNVNPVATGQSVTFTADVATVGQTLVPTGTVTFLDGSTVLGMAPLNGSGLATLTTSSLASGSHTISANYVGSSITAASSSTPLTETVNGTSSSAPFTLTVAGTPTVMTGQGVNLVITVAPRVGTIQPVQLSCGGLPAESACTFGSTTLPTNGGTTSLQISTMAPHSCESDTPYSQNAGIPFAGPALAGLMLFFLPRRRRKSMKNLLMVLVAICGIASLMGCGNCSDLGTRPGDYTIQIVGTSTGAATSKVVTKITLHVTVP
ncbi:MULTISPECIES: Ig-like domain-containing protein [Acidobacteriaceae]|uniref:Ig-like domain-containing protein n=1 Tax=Acidobacteriaceae TaxID=204434 RepID=UPI00131C899B|nr:MULTISPECIES: Ig-like domain-containing protein [Acidobacteriaceae]MDW5267935.1 Ig-like domain-containing protein [Edaphobacter sp.]